MLQTGFNQSGENAYQPLLYEQWDVVIDVWPEKSHLVEDAVRALVRKSKRYIYISNIAVYNDFQEVGLNENSEEKLSAENRLNGAFNCTGPREEPLLWSEFPELAKIPSKKCFVTILAFKNMRP